MGPTVQVDTKHVSDRRPLHFHNFEDLRADVERILDAEDAGRLRRTGNWSVAQVFNHVAAFMDYPYDGYPPQIHPPWFLRLILRLFMKNRFLNGSIPAGVRIPGIEGGTVATETCDLDAAAARLRRAIERMDRQAPQAPNPLFGMMPHEDWKKLNLRHAELHFSFLHP